MRMLIGCCIVCLSTFCLAADPVTQADLLRVSLAFNERTLVGEYDRVGKRDPKWDAPARAFLKAMVVRFAESTVMSDYRSGTQLPLAELLALSEKAVAGGCSDPLVLYCQATVQTDLGRGITSEKLQTLILNEFIERGYHPWRTFSATNRYVQLKLKDTDLTRKAKSRYLDDLLAFLQTPVVDPLELRSRYFAVNGVLESLPNAEREPLMERMEATPKIDPWLLAAVRGSLEIDLAWHSRGRGWASTVTPEGWEGFKKHLARARPALVKAWEMNKSFPEPAARMITLCMGGGGNDTDTGRLWFERANAAQIDYVPAWDNLMESLRPRWGGSYKQMHELGLAALQTARFDTLVPLLYLDALWEISHDGPTDWKIYTEPDVWPNIQRFTDGYMKSPLPGIDRAWLQSSHAALAYRCQQYQAFLELHAALKPGFDVAAAKRFGFSEPDALMVSKAATSDQAEVVITALAHEWNGDFQKASGTWAQLAKDLPPAHPAAVLATDSILLNRMRLPWSAGKAATIELDAPDVMTGFVVADPRQWTITAEKELRYVAAVRKDSSLQHRLVMPQNRRTSIEFQLDANGHTPPPEFRVLLRDVSTERQIECSIRPGQKEVRVRSSKGVYARNTAPVEIALNKWHRLEIEQRDASVSVRLNGQEVATGENSFIRGGTPVLALIVWAPDKGAGGRFRNIVIEPLKP